MSLILVTGATGAIGPSIIWKLHEYGHDVRILALDVATPGLLPTAVDLIVGDVTNQSVVLSALHRVDVVIHLAALLHIVDPPAELHDKYEQINVGGTTTVVDAAIEAGVKRVVLASTIAVYGPAAGHVLDEASVACPDTFYGRTKLAAEKVVLNARGADGRPIGTVLRFGTAYGPRIKGNFARLVRALARNRFIPIGNGRNRRTLIYDKDVARAVVLSAQHPSAAGNIYNVTDGQFHKLAEIIAAICRALGRAPPRLSIPRDPARFAAGLLEDSLRLMGCRSRIGRATVDKYTEDVAVAGNRIQHELGFVPQYDLDAGWRETVSEMRKSGNL